MPGVRIIALGEPTHNYGCIIYQLEFIFTVRKMLVK